MGGMPAIADIALLLRLLAHLGDHRIARHRCKEAVDVDLAKAPSQRNVLFRCQLLVAKEYDPVFAHPPPYFVQFRRSRRPRQIHARNLCPDMRREWCHQDVIVCHARLPTIPSNSYSGMASSVSKWLLSQTTIRSANLRPPPSSRIRSM